MQNPSFFIAGAPKCGTTTLYRWLKAHPDVYMPDIKEPHFHSVDLPGLREITSAEAYNSLFASAPPGTLAGEASASYLYSEVAVSRILEDTPEARFVVILRDPVEMAQALHAELLANLTEDIQAFEEAWCLQGARLAGESIPRWAREPKMLQYATVCAIGDQLGRFIARVPLKNRLILLIDDLRVDPCRVHARLLNFLDLRVVDMPKLTKANASHRLRSRRLSELHRNLPNVLGPLYFPAKYIGNKLGLSPSVIIGRVNMKSEARLPLNPGFQEELRLFFAKEVQKVEMLLERNLSDWR